MRISLIGTYHQEDGAVTVSALLQILERVKPEVVFAEIPPTHLEAWKDGSHGTVESIAVASYAGTRAVCIVPVDLPKPENAFFREYEEVIRAIERTSAEFRRLVDLDTDRRRREGFSYLNSDDCIQVRADIHRNERETIQYIGSSRLHDIYVQVRDLMELRELEMIRNICAYCVSTPRTSGVFLVGAAHRKSLIEKVRAAAETGIRRIEWDFSMQGSDQSASDAD